MTPIILRPGHLLWSSILATVLLNSCSYLPFLGPLASHRGQDYGEESNHEKIVENNMLRGVEYMKMGKYDVAMERLQAALNDDPNYAEAHNAIAVLYEQLGDANQAREHYNLALTLKPTDSDIHNNYGQFLCKQGQWLEADKQFLKAIENPMYRTSYIPYTNAALCALRNSDPTKAEVYLRKSLQINSKFDQALYWMAQLSYDQGFYTQATDYLQRYLAAVIEPTPDSLWLGFRLGQAQNDSKIMAHYAQQLRSQYPDSEATRLLNQESPPQ